MTEIVFILLAVFLLFGSKKMPDIARGIGKGYREFQKATDEIKGEIHKVANDVKNDVKNNIEIKDEIKNETTEVINSVKDDIISEPISSFKKSNDRAG